MRRLYASICGASLGWFVGAALNVPVWRDWQIGDRTDMTVTAFMLIWFGIGAARKADA